MKTQTIMRLSQAHQFFLKMQTRVSMQGRFVLQDGGWTEHVATIYHGERAGKILAEMVPRLLEALEEDIKAEAYPMAAEEYAALFDTQHEEKENVREHQGCSDDTDSADGGNGGDRSSGTRDSGPDTEQAL